MVGLNRTSVGLKQKGFRDEEWRRLRLNRTSVGLKPRISEIITSSRAKPQSNQRGIETSILFRRDRDGDQASIEPAWD